MLPITCALLAFIVSGARAKVWSVANAETLRDVLATAAAGDVVELESGEYEFSALARGANADRAPLRLNRPLTLRSRDAHSRAVLRNGGFGVLIEITSSSVTLADLIIGEQVGGVADERAIDLYIGAGTQTEPAGAAAHYHAAPAASAARDSPLASRSEFAAARSAQTHRSAPQTLEKRAIDAVRNGDMRALHSVRVSNVDFSASRAGTNVGVARGSYADLRIERCALGRNALSNALVAVGDAQFVDLAVHHNVLADGAHVLIGSPTVRGAALGNNYWRGDGAPQLHIGGTALEPTTYCLDVECARVGPIVDGDAPERAYPTLAAATNAGVRRILLTADTTLDEPVIVLTSATTIEGATSDRGAPLLTVRAGAAIVSHRGALSGVRNVRVRLVGNSAAAFVFTDGAAQSGAQLPSGAQSFATLLTAMEYDAAPPSAEGDLVYFDGVSVLGDGESAAQTAVLLSAPTVRVELEDSVLVQVAHGAIVHRGALALVDSTFFGAHKAAVSLSGATHQAALRAAGATFVGCARAIDVSGSVSALQELYVSCSQFLFNGAAEPLQAHECATKPTLCAKALRYNTIVSDHSAGASSGALAHSHRLLAQGNNHIEFDRERQSYVYFGDVTHFSLHDDQGRLSWASGALHDAGEAHAWLLASYAPMRAECFAVDGVSAEAAIVSDVLEVRSDALLHAAAASLALRFRVAASDTELDRGALAVYAAAHLGASTRWERQVTHMRAAQGGETTLESSVRPHASNERHAHRFAVLATQALPERVADALASGAALANAGERPLARVVCVACGGAQVAAHVVDEQCGGSSANVHNEFDEAYAALGLGRRSGAPRSDGVALLVIGECVTKQATVVLDHNENLLGLSTGERGALRRADAALHDGKPLIEFSARASPQSSLRYVIVAGDVLVGKPSTAARLGPTIAYSSIGGALRVEQRAGGRYIGNDIGGDGSSAIHIVLGDAATSEHAVVIEANALASGGATVVVSGEYAHAVHIDRNSFARGSGAGVQVQGSGGERTALHTDRKSVV